MTILQAIILGIVEGLTEFLPVSSTGHMIICQSLMGMQSDEYLKAFTVMIQFGAILSVIVLYWRHFFIFRTDIRAKTPLARFMSRFDFYWKLLVAVIPAAIIGMLAESYIDRMLGSVAIVAIMLFLGGVFMLFIDLIFRKGKKEKPSFLNAFFIGLFQCIAMIPGVSRSMATIAGGMQQGLTRKAAAEFSFFLAVPTMFGATIVKAYKLYQSSGFGIFQDNAMTLIVGNVVAFVVAMVAIRFFIGVVTRYGFRAFGYYRIVVGVAIAAMLLAGVPLSLA